MHRYLVNRRARLERRDRNTSRTPRDRHFRKQGVRRKAARTEAETLGLHAALTNTCGTPPLASSHLGSTETTGTGSTGAGNRHGTPDEPR